MEGGVELDGEEVEDDDGGAFLYAEGESGKYMGRGTQMACYHAEGEADETDAEGYDGHQGATESAREQGACGREQYGMGHKR